MLQQGTVEGAGWHEKTPSPCHGDSEMRGGTDKSQFPTHGFETHNKFPTTLSKLGLYLQDLRPVLQASITILHLQTEGWSCCALGKPAPRASPVTPWALQVKSHPFPSRWWWHPCCWSKNSFSMPLKSTCCRRKAGGKKKSIKPQKAGLLFREQMVKLFVFKTAHFNLLGCCSLPNPIGTLSQVHCGVWAHRATWKHPWNWQLKLHQKLFTGVELLAVCMWGQKKIRNK